MLVDPNLAAQSVTTERQYIDDTPLRYRRDAGQFFTPPNVAALMADWATDAGRNRLLDPSLGTGMLAAACLKRSPHAQVTAYEKDARILSYVPPEVAKRISIFNDDFLKAEVEDGYEGVVMNPPYIRHREIEGYENERLDISAGARCIIPRSANLYIYFAVKAISLLEAGGRGSILIPSEWMSANFSTSFKNLLTSRGLLKHLVTFSNCSNVFDDALTTASVLLVERNYD